MWRSSTTNTSWPRHSPSPRCSRDWRSSHWPLSRSSSGARNARRCRRSHRRRNGSSRVTAAADASRCRPRRGRGRHQSVPEPHMSIEIRHSASASAPFVRWTTSRSTSPPANSSPCSARRLRQDDPAADRGRTGCAGQRQRARSGPGHDRPGCPAASRRLRVPALRAVSDT